MVRGVGGGILEGRQLFLIFPSKGGGRLFEGGD